MPAKLAVYAVTASSLAGSALARPALAWEPTVTPATTATTTATIVFIVAPRVIEKRKDSNDGICMTDGVAIQCSWTTSGAFIPDFISTTQEATSTSTIKLAERTANAEIDQYGHDPADAGADGTLEANDATAWAQYRAQCASAYPENEGRNADPETTIPTMNGTGSVLEARHVKDSTITYCDNTKPAKCATITLQNEDCLRLSGVFPMFQVPTGLKCAIYELGSCHKQLFVKKGKIDQVEGDIDLRSDPRAPDYSVGNVGSFFCY